MSNIEWKRYWLMVGLHPDMLPGLKAAVYQDAETGWLRWVENNAGRAQPNGIAGFDVNGERVLSYRRRKIYVSSVVWLLHHNVLPPNGVVKYKDGNPRNLHIENLYLTEEAK